MTSVSEYSCELSIIYNLLDGNYFTAQLAVVHLDIAAYYIAVI